ncbi:MULTISPECIES: flagellar motor switch protein FliM [unclassified Candidatus Frackibacter]|uniref:flagellar motor switch protein FliM n=1 Tax=unclassified Candidatus Frackibacter TaxID=2648818 RepID=UPI000798FBE6|nr:MULTISPECIES: flagellar motor switch protein FliM [unclassified Candidatus Frackibacter]KXS40609.1 MAG: flagellar motor switch protein FliM [Candidatus Frackibacter sp. T328-2]SEM31085.1 flagellar motor switch protein FliM [Candidatus Frackibacter sp. WG12]SFL36056.1 flagellar motor switch protein FliM [Candidatus Frackibacter sp. WG13]
MANDRVLSQNEIDNLLNDLNSGKVEAEEIKEESNKKSVQVYDFKRPDKLSKDQLRTLRMIYENFARLVTTTLSTQLRTMVRIELNSIEQLSYDEFIRSLPQPTIMSVCDFNPLPGEFILEVNPKVGYAIIERLFGGKGTAPDDIRDFTDIEEMVLKRVIKNSLGALIEAWENVVELKPRIKSLESNPQFTQIVPSNDMVILATFDAQIAEAEGLINVCIPYIVLEPIVDKLNAQYWFSTAREGSNKESVRKLKNRLNKATLPVVINLASTTITVADLLDLQVGDVIKLDEKADQEAKIKIGSKDKFKGRPGVIGSKLAVEISGVLDEGEEGQDE